MINRRHLLGIVPLAATLLLAGCAADSQTEQGQTADGLRAIRLTATVSDGARADTRAAIDIQSEQFEQGETFYAHFPSGASVSNSTFETSDASGETTCTGTQPYFNAGVSEVRVHAYYPQTVREAANQTFSVALDQTGNANYKASDLMYATTTVSVNKSTQTSATGELHFSHKMSKIIVNASCEQGVSKIKKVRIVNGFKTIGIANPMTTNENTSPFFGETPSRTNAITTADEGCVKLYEDATGGATVNCAGLIPPQTIDGSFLQVVTSEGTATYSLASKTFVSGESYTYSIKVSLASIGTKTDITNWGTTDGTTTLVDGGTEKLYYCSGIALDDANVAVGMIICEHGKAHDYTDGELPCHGTKWARITYVGSVPGYFDKFLAIALEDASSSYGDWPTQMSVANTWAQNHPVTVDGTAYNSCSTSAYDQVTDGGFTSMPNSGGTAVKGWRVPSVTDWKYIFAGIGGKAVDNSAVTDGIVYSSGTDYGDEDDSHRALLNKWCGQAWDATTKPQAVQSDDYWSSSESAEDTDCAWNYRFDDSLFYWDNKAGDYYVRAVFAY